MKIMETKIAQLTLVVLILLNTFSLVSAQNSTISGTVFYDSDTPFANVNIQLLDINGDVIDSAFTNVNGNYFFNNLKDQSVYYIKPMGVVGQPQFELLNGVSTFDLVMISKHLLAEAALPSPFVIVSGDINESGSLTTLDLIIIRQLILGLSPFTPINRAWRFIRSDWSFDSNDVFANLNQAEQVQVITNGAIQTQNFRGLKLGDVNGSAVINP